MPEDIYGVKIDDFTACAPGEPCSNSVTVSFDSDRLPTWGDFYARCGIRTVHEDGLKEWNSAYNTGFTGDDNTAILDDTDPTGSVESGSLGNHILTPDGVAAGSGVSGFTYSGEVAVAPEPASTALFIAGAVFLGGRYIRKKRS
ncbi:PEP-CTERM sorting domain-containing protein [bacterium]|nr:PEP-CTERM sorting domain-containing protein [bacterium]